MPIRLPALASIILLLATLPALAAPKAELWERWLANDPQSTLSVDHGTWEQFLKTYLVPGADGINRVAYSRVTRRDWGMLDGYVARLAATPVSRLSRGEQRPYWINLYNALTVQVVLAHYPVKSIRDINISPGLFTRGPWGKRLLTIEGEAVSLDDIEHRILRPIWRDPRIHYAVNCASLGCPKLQGETYTAANTDALLDRGAREYVNHPRGARIEGGKLVVSSIYDWFTEDFGGSEQGVIAHLKRYAKPELASQLERFTRIADYEYDWLLNDAR